MIRTAASLVGIVAAFALVLYLTYNDSGGDSAATPAPSPAVRASPTLTPSPTVVPPPLPDALEGTRVEALSTGQLVRLPPGVALITETSCDGCNGPEAASGLRRIYRDPITDHVRVEQLLSIEMLGLPPRIARTPEGLEEQPPYFTGIAIAPDASHMLVSICVEGVCERGPRFPLEGRVAVYESRDGGVTWTLVGDGYNPRFSVIGYIGPERAVAGDIDPETGEFTYYEFPSMEELRSPKVGFPVVSIGDTVLWGGKGGELVTAGDVTVLDLGHNALVQPDLTYSASRFTPIVWNYNAKGGPNALQTFVTLLDSGYRIDSTYRIVPDGRQLIGAYWSETNILGRGALIGTMTNVDLLGPPSGFNGRLPAILYPEEGRYNLIEEPFLQEGFEPQNDTVRAVQPGPFARVSGVGDSCLNVRAAPALDSEVLTCAAEGVLLRVQGGPKSGSDGNSWLAVETPDGATGWAATGFLEYEP